ncbi:MAG: AMP-binding protein [Myxococcales bacterium]|nr:AMP-binding protein [Myxococcales bacterium]
MRTANPQLIVADMMTAFAEANPDLDVLTFEGAGVREDEVRTNRQLVDNAHRIAKALSDRGMEPGDRFALLMQNHPEFVETMIAASITNCVIVPIDPRTRGDKLAYTLNNSNCKGILCADYALAQVNDVLGRTPELGWALVLESDEAGALPVSDCAIASPLREVLAAPLELQEIRTDDPMSPFEIIYTSGTTGDPKGVVMGGGRFCMSSMVALLVGWADDERPYTGLSLTHGNAQLLTLSPALAHQKRAVFSRKFTKSRLWDICRKYGCTVFNLLGGMTTAIYSEPIKENDADNPVRRVFSAGMPSGIWERFAKRFDVQVVEGYGAVEGGFALNNGDGPVGSFGKPVGMEMKIVDEDGNECPPGVQGELISRPLGGEAEVEYFGNKDASEKKTWGGWLRSGDVCHTDEDGWFYFDYRKGGGIRHNGDFVNPGFVEAVVAEHPAVTDVFVYGVTAASGAPGEKDVVAAIVLAEGADFDKDALFEHCKRGLEPNFVPSHLQVVAEIPKTASEKPQERFLTAAFEQDRSNVHSR